MVGYKRWLDSSHRPCRAGSKTPALTWSSKATLETLEGGQEKSKPSHPTEAGAPGRLDLSYKNQGRDSGVWLSHSGGGGKEGANLRIGAQDQALASSWERKSSLTPDSDKN